MKHIVFFSSGVGSWVAAKRVVEKHGVENTVLLFTDTGIEDEDNYRFLHEAAANIGAPLHITADGRTPWDVFKDQRWIGNSRVAPCSHILKQATARKWLDEHDPGKTATLYVGIDWSEIHRVAAIEKGWSPRKVSAPLCDAPYLDKRDMIAMAESEGLKPPRMYGMGFSHANCGGFCVRGGKGHFAVLLRSFTDGEGQK
jgi:3'-phosphoadenosine 5'-phosphosulfate sulfotransferase (PAPS reductase)/FAD synthetase